MNSKIQDAINGKVKSSFIEQMIVNNAFHLMNRKLLKLLKNIPSTSLQTEENKKDQLKKRLQQKLKK